MASQLQYRHPSSSSDINDFQVNICHKVRCLSPRLYQIQDRILANSVVLLQQLQLRSAVLRRAIKCKTTIDRAGHKAAVLLRVRFVRQEIEISPWG